MLNNKIKISVVSYLNSKPFILALKKAQLTDVLEISLDIPSDCAAKLLDNRVDIGLVPVTIIPKLPRAKIIGNHCIAADGEVGSVLLLSDVPLHEIQKIYLDNESRTSVELVRILSEKFWKINPDWLSAKPGYEKYIKGHIAGVIIGDRALKEKKKFPYAFDLAEEWKKLTGLPFVFACWVANKEIDPDIREKLTRALSTVSDFIPDVIESHNEDGISKDEVELYFKKNIQYDLDEKKMEGMKLFLQFLEEEHKPAGK
ncbi:MAG: hypothetical protein EYC69_03085 [Bacteroidetes bacterium]|nr:MAG: hypothetical protein EYC69_03085 [Bacteroidota bacterium]